VEKYGTATQATDGSIIWRMLIACWMAKATETHSEYVILIFHGKNGYSNALAITYIHTFPGLFLSIVPAFRLSDWRKSGKSIR
jgi:hypothetical protein